MKLIKILAVLIVLINFTAKARTFIPAEANFLSTVNEASIVKVEQDVPNCPPVMLCTPKTVVTVRLDLKGCLDKLGPVSTSVVFNEDTGKHTIVLNAINIHVRDSENVVCFAKPFVTTKVSLDPFVYTEDIELQLLK